MSGCKFAISFQAWIDSAPPLLVFFCRIRRVVAEFGIADEMILQPKARRRFPSNSARSDTIRLTGWGTRNRCGRFRQ